MYAGVCGIAPWQRPSPVLSRPLLGVIPATSRWSHRLAERLRARLRSLLGINPQWRAL